MNFTDAKIMELEKRWAERCMEDGDYAWLSLGEFRALVTRLKAAELALDPDCSPEGVECDICPRHFKLYEAWREVCGE